MRIQNVVNRCLIVVALMGVIACGSPETETAKQELPEKEVEVSDTNTLYLDGMYATSTALPQTSFQMEYLLDNDLSTSWSPMPGAGPDEGIMMYFSQPTYLYALEVFPIKKPELAEIESVILYINGQKWEEESLNMGELWVLEAESVSSLYLRIGFTSGTEYIEVMEMDEQLTIFDAEKSIGIAEIRMYESAGLQLDVRPPYTLTGSVTATSTLSPEAAYSADHLFDSRKELAWAEGNSENGQGEMLTFALDKATSLTGLKIWNGYQRSDKHYEDNARIKTLSFGPIGGESAVYTLDDLPGIQGIFFDQPMEGNSFVLKVEEVYEGKKYPDMLVSEIRLLNQNRTMRISSGPPEAQQRAILEQAKGSVLEPVLDRRHFQASMAEDRYRSLIIRSNQTFVLYQYANYEGDKEEVIADGNWELQEIKDGEAKIRVFGKYVNLTESVDFYKGSSSETSFARVFSDNVTIGSTVIKGERFIDKFNRQP